MFRLHWTVFDHFHLFIDCENESLGPMAFWSDSDLLVLLWNWAGLWLWIWMSSDRTLFYWKLWHFRIYRHEITLCSFQTIFWML